jgi:hypothetical protein
MSVYHFGSNTVLAQCLEPGVVTCLSSNYTLPLQLLGTVAEWCFDSRCIWLFSCTTFHTIVLFKICSTSRIRRVGSELSNHCCWFAVLCIICRCANQDWFHFWLFQWSVCCGGCMMQRIMLCLRTAEFRSAYNFDWTITDTRSLWPLNCTVYHRDLYSFGKFDRWYLKSNDVSWNRAVSIVRNNVVSNASDK